MISRHLDLTDAQWEVLHLLIPEAERREDGRGRPWKGRREVLNGILYILRTGAAWADLPDCYPPYQTCHRRFLQWVRSGVMQNVLEALAEEPREKEESDAPMQSVDPSLCLDPWPGVSDLDSLGNAVSLPPKPARSALKLLERRLRR